MQEYSMYCIFSTVSHFADALPRFFHVVNPESIPDPAENRTPPHKVSELFSYQQKSVAVRSEEEEVSPFWGDFVF